MTDGPLGAALFGDPEVASMTSDASLVARMLDTEAALALALADAGIAPSDGAGDVAAACASLDLDTDLDLAELGRASLSSGTPVVPLVGQLSAAVPATARPWLHHGATSQDVVDTALMLVSRDATARIAQLLDTVADRCAALAQQHRDTVMLARTLGQAAAPTTFGRIVAGWLTGLTDAAVRLDMVRSERLAVQLGGPVGTRAAYGDSGEQVARHLADRLGLSSPDLPWHTDRQRVLDLGFALTGVAAAVGKLATDVALLAATEVGELRLSSAGGSSSMPHKRNPTPAVLARSGALRAPGLLATLVAAASTPEHERATGAWHAEWQPWRELLDVVGGMVAHSESMLTSLEADEAAMRSNLDATGGVVMAASVAARLAPAIGHNAAETLVTTCAAQVSPTLSFADVLGADPAITDALSRDELAAALDPIRWLGSASEMVDRAVERHTQRRAGASSS